MRRPAALLLGLAALAATGCTLQRPEDPVVITGAQLPALAEVEAGDLVAFRWFNGWEQVPVQVDERKYMDLNEFWEPLEPPPPSVPPSPPVYGTVYADPATAAGADTDPDIDADDEVALMVKDLGMRRPAGTSAPAGVVGAGGVEVKVRSTLGGTPREAWVYLFERSGDLDPSAGKRYVDYTLGTNGTGQVTTPWYREHFSARWVTDELHVTAGGASGADILDRNKIRVVAGDCTMTEQRFSENQGGFIANKSGPVRAIRSYMGANSGPLTQRDHFFYEQRQDVVTYLRVHAIQGVIDYFDYSRAAVGMIYRNNSNRAGVTIDGNPDTLSPGAPIWETVDGAQGGLSHVHRVDTDIPDLALTAYYVDDFTPDETQCTGDSEAVGASGPHVDQLIPDTDPTFPPTNRLTGYRTLYFEEPGKTNGPARAAQADSPFQVTVSTGP